MTRLDLLPGALFPTVSSAKPARSSLAHRHQGVGGQDVHTLRPRCGSSTARKRRLRRVRGPRRRPEDRATAGASDDRRARGRDPTSASTDSPSACPASRSQRAWSKASTEPGRPSARGRWSTVRRSREGSSRTGRRGDASARRGIERLEPFDSRGVGRMPEVGQQNASDSGGVSRRGLLVGALGVVTAGAAEAESDVAFGPATVRPGDSRYDNPLPDSAFESSQLAPRRTSPRSSGAFP